MLINVTQEHIDAGQRQICVKCPVALAINDALNGAFLVGVEFTAAYIYPRVQDGGFASVSLPVEVRTFIHEFDSTGQGMPFSFEIDIPQEYLKCSST